MPITQSGDWTKVKNQKTKLLTKISRYNFWMARSRLFFDIRVYSECDKLEATYNYGQISTCNILPQKY